MKHASEQSLEKIENLLKLIRKFSCLRERKTGVFYKGGKAYLHFHESSDADLFADIRLSGDTTFVRYDVSTQAKKELFLKLLQEDLG